MRPFSPWHCSRARDQLVVHPPARILSSSAADRLGYQGISWALLQPLHNLSTSPISPSPLFADPAEAGGRTRADSGRLPAAALGAVLCALDHQACKHAFLIPLWRLEYKWTRKHRVHVDALGASPQIPTHNLHRSHGGHCRSTDYCTPHTTATWERGLAAGSTASPHPSPGGSR